MDPLKVIKLCKQNCIQKDLPISVEDYNNYHAKTKGNAPLKQFSILTDKEKNNFYKFIYFENKLNEVSNDELKYSIFCSLLENGSIKTKAFIQETLDMQPSQQFTCRNIQALKQQENNKTFIDQIKKVPKQFKPYTKLIKSDSDESIESTSTNDGDDDNQIIVKRFEQNEKVQKVQTLLKKQGINIQADGIMNSETENAICQYQKQNNMYQDGLITQNLINRLEGVKGNKEKTPNQPKIGGVNLNASIKEVNKIRGVKFDKKNQLKFLVDKDDKFQFSGVDSDDLALCLRIYYDTTIKNKVISFSLDPWEEKNPEGEFQKKVLYPDVLEKNKKCLSGSRFSELMFECDYLLKQMSLGLLPDSKTPFSYPQELIKLGLKPLSDIIEDMNKVQNQETSKHNWSRLWLVCRKIEGFVDENKKGVFLTNDVKIEVDARQMEQDSQGRLVDKVSQDKTDPCYIFAKKFSELYPVISKHYPCFEELKKLYRASALARWIASNGLSIDMTKVNQACQRQFSIVKNYKEKVNSIRLSSQIDYGTFEKKIPVDVKVVAERSLKQSGQEVNEKNIKLAIDFLIKQNNGSKEFFDTQKGKKVQSKFVMGGVDMNCQISAINAQPKVQIQNIPSSKQQVTSSAKPLAQVKPIASSKDKGQKEEAKLQEISGNYDGESDFYSNASTSMTSLDDNYIQQQVREEDFSFALQTNCEKCKKELSQLEQKIPIDSKYYCSLHHPYSCFYCGKLITEQAATVQGRAELYDADSFKNQQVLMHLDCNLIFQNKCVDKANLDKQNEEIEKINSNVLTQVKKNMPQIKSLNEMLLKKGTTFNCNLCKKNNTNSSKIVCNLCGLVNQTQANTFLKESFPQK